MQLKRCARVAKFVRKVGHVPACYLRVVRADQLSLAAVNPLAGGKLGVEFFGLDRRCPSRISIYITAAPRNQLEMEYPERHDDRSSSCLPAVN